MMPPPILRLKLILAWQIIHLVVSSSIFAETIFADILTFGLKTSPISAEILAFGL